MKVALVTGAGQGIGRAIAVRLAREGFALALADINASALAGVQAQIEAAGGKALALPADLSAVAEVRRVMARAAADLGGLDVLVNNAGRLITQSFLDVGEAEWDATLGLDLKTV